MKKIFYLFLIIFAVLIFAPVKSFAVGEYGPSWEKNTISVYIPSGNSYSSTMKHAFQNWQDRSFGQLKFEFIDKTPADIEVEFSDKTDGTDEEAGSYTLTVQGGFITKAQIIIAPTVQKYSKAYIYTLMLHEIGHALGLRDTRRNLGIMHSPVNEAQDIISNDIVRLFKLNGWSFMRKDTFVNF